MSQNIEYGQTIAHATARGNLLTKHNLFAVIMHSRIKTKRACILAQHLSHPTVQDGIGCYAATARCDYRPTSKATCHLLHVFLCIAAIDTKRVQLHQFARVVFVNAAALWLLLRLLL